MTEVMRSRQPNPVVHIELHTADLAGASALYSELCGWRPEPVETCAGRYLAFEFGTALAAGMVESGAHHPIWLPYVQVDRIEAATDRARRLGASVAVEPREGPVGWRSVVSTPCGGELAFWQPKGARDE
jgi:predicted enzyme related to lactoylglutathione lyase